jgi:hypothetical protein
MKFPDRYAANIKQAVNISTGKLNGLKNHEYHIFIERLMPVMFCGYFKADCGRCLLNTFTSTDKFVLSKSQKQ